MIGNIPASMIEAAARALHEHDRVDAVNEPRWDAITEPDRDSYRAAVQPVLAAAFAECEVREQWRYVWSDGERSTWFDGEPAHLGREYVKRDGAKVTSQAAERRRLWLPQHRRADQQ